MAQTSFLGGFWDEEHGEINDFPKFRFFMVTGPLQNWRLFCYFWGTIEPSMISCSTDLIFHRLMFHSYSSDFRHFDFLWWNKVTFQITFRITFRNFFHTNVFQPIRTNPFSFDIYGSKKSRFLPKIAIHVSPHFNPITVINLKTLLTWKYVY